MSPRVAAAPHHARRTSGGLLQGVRQAERLASLGFAIALWTVIAAPALHLSNHRADHVHTGATSRVAFIVAAQPPARHDHGDGAVHSHAPDPEPSDAPPSRDHHGRGAAEHFGLLVLGTPVFVVPPAPEL
ncbi:MAG TPA: hypothetical protein VGF45_04455, partial [Polyangia bacterium]